MKVRKTTLDENILFCEFCNKITVHSHKYVDVNMFLRSVMILDVCSECNKPNKKEGKTL